MSATVHAPLNGASPSGRPTMPRGDAPRPQFVQLKGNVHKKLLNRLNLEALATVDRQRAESEIRALVFELMAEEATPVSIAEREQVLSDILDEVFGLGPLEPLLRDPTVNDILVNTYKFVYVERNGVLQ
jgi:pilus assembly protein CpaF